jgi:hypothetical protein
MVVLPSIETELQFLGLLIEIEFRTQSIMLILAAALAAVGTDWLIQAHPQRERTRLAAENWVIPALAALAVGVIVIRVQSGISLWIGLLLSALLLIAIFSAEFIVSYPDDPRYEWVASILTGLALLLLTAAFVTIYTTQLRALFAVPLTFFAGSIVSWRVLKLNLPSSRVWPWAILISSVTSQMAVGLHYWPISALPISLLLGLTHYVCYRLVSVHMMDELKRADFLENTIVASIALIGIFILI